MTAVSGKIERIEMNANEIYFNARIQEKIKEEIMDNPILQENKIVRDFFTIGFMKGVETVEKVLSDIAEVNK